MGPTTYKSQGAQLLETKDSAIRSLHSAHSSLYTLPLPGMVNVHTMVLAIQKMKVGQKTSILKDM